jgi:hypothetical protein
MHILQGQAELPFLDYIADIDSAKEKLQGQLIEGEPENEEKVIRLTQCALQ